MSQLEQALIGVIRFLNEHQVPYMIIGGIANAVWGIPRTTLDVDLTVLVAEENLDTFLRSLVRVFHSRVSDPLAFVNDTHVLPLVSPEGVRIDMVFAQFPYEEQAIQRAARERIQGVEARVCQPEDLIIHKLVSERPKDRDDVHGIIQQQAKRLDRAYLDPKVTALARELARPDIQTWYDQCWQGTRSE